MSTLVAIGTSAAYGYSAAVTFFGPWFHAQGLPTEVYYDTSTIIIALILLGRYLEARAKGQTTAAIRRRAATKRSSSATPRSGRSPLTAWRTSSTASTCRSSPG